MAASVAKAAVIGAGSMGSGIAAQFANAGVPVVLLDLPSDGGDPNALAAAGLARQVKAGGFMHPRQAKLVSVGNTRDHLNSIADADWIVEAVIEDREVKGDLFRRVEAVRKDGSAVSSNTSSIALAQLTEGMGKRFAADFVITHFFNPPRHMRLVELVTGPGTRREAAALVRGAADRILGKTVIDCRDTPGFIANRIGCYWMTVALMEALDLGLTVEEADAVAGRPFGIPRTGIFGLLDLVGIDLVPLVWGSLLRGLPENDPHRRYAIVEQPLLRRMIDEGYTGRKGKGGFYRVVSEGGGKRREVLDLESGLYRPERPPALDGLDDLRGLTERDDRIGRYAWRVLANTVGYAAEVAAAIAEDIGDIDTALELGYNWSAGPFALADRVGCEWLASRLAAEGRTVPPLLAEAARDGGFHRRAEGRVMLTTGGTHPLRRPEGVLSLADVKARRAPVAGNGSASLWDIGDGAACLEIHTKMNAVDHGALDIIERAVQEVPRGFRALVIGNENPRAFSAGANLAFIMERLDAGDAEGVDAYVARGQAAVRALAQAPFPVVGAAAGLALGGGCEILLHCDAIQAHAETYVGLVEANVGLIPGWGGCTRLLMRHHTRPNRIGGPLPPCQAAFETIAARKVSQSALQARDLGFLRPPDGITMNRDRLLADAKARALGMCEDYTPAQPPSMLLPGRSGWLALMNGVAARRRLGRMSDHDEVVAGELAWVLTGGEASPVAPVSPDDLYRLEREAVARLLRLPATRERLAHMLKTGKPLRN